MIYLKQCSNGEEENGIENVKETLRNHLKTNMKEIMIKIATVVTVSLYFLEFKDVFDNCCATLEVLEPRDRRGRRVNLFKNGKLDFDEICRVERFEATGSCITVDLKCFCAVQCIKDVHIRCEESSSFNEE